MQDIQNSAPDNSPMPTIVLIEDDGLILRMYEKKLALDGYNVIGAANGKDGLDLIKQHKPALILCDVMMPELNGFQVLEAVKADPELAHIPFITLTNLNQPEDAARAIEMGATTYLVKVQIMPADVVAKVKEVLKASGATAPQSAALSV
jgi:CheY-like chemotaxis protein